jgi:hypothetical protein
MDEQNQDLERELQTLKPVAPSAALWRRLETEMQQNPAEARPRYRSATTLSTWKWAGWQIAAAAAAVAIVGTAAVMRMLTPPASAPVVAQQQQPPARSTIPSIPVPDIYQPVKAENLLYDLRDEGQVMLANDQAARRTRYHFVDTYTWKNQRGNATVRWTIPREEVRFVPVAQN